MPYVTIEGRALHYRDVGAGKPVLLLHGFPLTGASFWPQLDAPPAGHRLIVPDHRGFGQSAPGDGPVSGGPARPAASLTSFAGPVSGGPARPAASLTSFAGPLTMENIAADALALLDALKLPTAIVGGVSMGGYAAMAMLRLNASRVAGLVLIDTQCTADDDAGKARREQTAKDVEASGMAGLAEAMVPKLLSPAAPPELRQRVEAMMRSVDPKGAAAASRGMALRSDSKELLSRFAGPALIVVGDGDVITPPAKAKEMEALMSQSRLVELQHAGHLSNLEQPEAFNAALAEFLSF